MKYLVEFRPEAERDISRLDKVVAQRVLTRIKWLAEHIEDIQLEALQGKRWKGLFKLRVGDYRVLFAVYQNRKLLSVHFV
ncbi:MAG: type II toxin-antitoxin system RelE family toxin, partial [Candidatus Binatia bacterium]